MSPKFRTSRSNLIFALEPRMMYDGAMVAEAAVTLSAAAVTADAQHADTSADSSQTTAPTQHTEVVFIDSSVQDYQAVADKFTDTSTVNYEVYTVAQGVAGYEYMADVLSGMSGVDAVHVVGHGSDGEITLGTDKLNENDLSSYNETLKTIGSAISADGDLLFYGCDIAQDSYGQKLVSDIADITGADVAASTDITGNADHGADWILEYSTGTVATKNIFADSDVSGFDSILADAGSFDLSGKDGWTAIMYGAGKDPQGDSQAGAADTDIVGDAAHGSLYTSYDDNGTPDDTSDDYLCFRMRIDNPTSSTKFGGVALVGMDANLDGKIDLFMCVDGRNNSQSVKLLDPGTGLNVSPATTSTTALPTGWLPNNGVYSFSSTNYSVVAVTSSTDPNWNGNTDLGGNGKTDVFVSWKISMSDLATVLSKPSPVDRNGNAGPRGTDGIQGFSKDTVVQYVNFTQTQPGPINGDLNGVGASYDKNATFADLGAFTAPMSASNPVSDGPGVNITSVDTLLNATEDNNTSVGGTTVSDGYVHIHVTDGTNYSDLYTQADSSGNWTVDTGDLSGFADGTLTYTADLVDASHVHVDGSIGSTATSTHDTTPPAVSVDSLLTAGRPVVSGTTDMPAGSQITVSIDPNGDGVLSDLVTYIATVTSTGTWSVNTATATPSTGYMPSSGLTAYAGVTATATDEAGNSATAAAIDKPTVNSMSTASTSPTVTGTWGGSNGGTDALTVTVNGVTYAQGDGYLTTSGNTWTLNAANNTGADALSAGSTYDVTAKVIRNLTEVTDTTTGELVIVNGPIVDITGGATSISPLSKPLITGSTTAGAVVVVSIDKDNNSATTDDIIRYSVTADGSGNWTLDTASATPLSGNMPSGGLSGTIGVTATVTDSANRTATDAQAVTITIPTVYIDTPISGGYFNNAEDNTASISGTAINGDGQYVTLHISDGSTILTFTDAAQVSGGAWTATGLDLSSLRETGLTVTATVGSASDTAPVIHDTYAYIAITSGSSLTASKPVITGDAEGSTVTISIDAYTKSGSNIVYSSTAVYSGITVTGGTWSLDTNAATPTSGTLPTSGLNNTNEYYLVTVTTTDAAGNIGTDTLKIIKSSTTTSVAITTPISTDNIVNETEDDSFSISGTTTSASGYVLITVTDGTNTITQEVQASSGSWTASGLNIDTFKDGEMTVKAELLQASGSSTVLATDTDLVQHVNGNTIAATVSVNEPVGDGNLSDAEDNSVTISGTTTNAADGTTVSVTISDTDAATADLYTTATVTGNTWTVSGVDLSSLADGTLTVTASMPDGSGGTATDNANVLHDTVAPYVTVTPLSTAGTPVISGTTDLPAGSVITVSIDPDNNAVTADTVTYTATVMSGGTWSVDTSTATPDSGTMPADGLTDHAAVTAAGTDAAGNATTVTAINIPVVNSQITNDTTPVITGDWTNAAGNTLTVTVNGHTYTVGDGNLTVSDNTWSLTIPSAMSEGTYNVTATVTNIDADHIDDTTSGELVIDTTAPAVTITGISNDTGSSANDYITNDTTLVYTGTADADGYVLVSLKNEAGSTVFSTTLQASGTGVWSLDRTALGSLADGNYVLTATSTDAAGNTATTAQDVTIDTSSVISLTTNVSTTNTHPTLSGTTDIEAGQVLTVMVDPNNDGNWSDAYSYNAIVKSDGTWSVQTTDALSGTVAIKVTGTDIAGNTYTSAEKTMTISALSPEIHISTPLDSNGDSNGTLTTLEDTSVVITGTVTNVSDNELIYISITDGNKTVTDTVKVVSGQWSMDAINLRGMANGTITVTASYTDDSGNTFSDIATVDHVKGGSVSIDSISDDTGLYGDFKTNDNTLAFYGSSGAGENITLLFQQQGSGTTVFSTVVTADSTGAWSYDYSSVLPDGTYLLTATGSSTLASQAVTVDTTAPTGPVTVNTLTTNDSTPSITGTATVAAGETLTVTVNGITYTDGDGNLTLSGTAWTLNVPDTLAEGTYSVTAAITDETHNTLTDSTNSELVIDTTAPTGPVTVNTLTTNDSTPAITGTATVAAGETLTVTVNGTTYTDGDGKLTLSGTTWTLNVPTALADGTYSVTAAITDSANNKLTDSTSSELVINTASPSAPAGPVTVNTLTTNDNTPSITGTASVAAGETLTVTVNGVTYTAGDGKLTLSGTTWTLNVPTALADGTYSVTATITDASSNTLTDSTDSELVVDTTAPTGPVTVNTLTTNDSTPAITGTATVAADETLTVTVNGVTYTAGDGKLTLSGTTWTLNVPTALADGTYSVTATITDTLHNTLTDSTNSELVIDATAPAGPVTVNALTTNDSTPAITGTATVAAGETLTVTVNGVTYTAGDGKLTLSGTTWTLNVPTALADGTYSVTATITDASSNTLTDSTSSELVVDTTPTSAPTGPVTVDTLITNDSTPAITGTATVAAGETLTVTVNGVTYTAGDGKLALSGTTWTLDVPTALADGTYSVTATITDASSNTLTDSTSSELTVDTTVPIGPVTVISQITNDNTPTITGTAFMRSGETLTVAVNGSTYTFGDGYLTLTGSTWTLNLPSALADGTYGVTASITDDAHNKTTDSTSAELIVDTTAPAGPVTVNTLTTNDNTPSITGTASVAAGEKLTVTINGTTYTAGDGHLTLSGTTWILNIPSALADGTYSVTAAVTDGAHNTTTDTTDSEVTIDTKAPTGPVTVDTITTDDTTPAITGTASVASGETLTVTVNGTTYTVGDGHLTLSGTTWTLNVPTALADGTYNVTAQITDATGNFIKDTTDSEIVISTVPTITQQAPQAAQETPAAEQQETSPAPISVASNQSSYQFNIDSAGNVNHAVNGINVITPPQPQADDTDNTAKENKTNNEDALSQAGKYGDHTRTVNVSVGFDGTITYGQKDNLFKDENMLKVTDIAVNSGNIKMLVSDKDGKVVRYKVFTASGTPLPEWLTFDPSTGQIYGTVPKGINTIKLLVIGIDTDNKELSMIVDVDLSSMQKAK